MGCCSVTPKATGIDEVGPDEIELLDIDAAGVWTLGESRLQVSARTETNDLPHRCPSVRQFKEEVPDPISSQEFTQKRNSQVVLWGWTKDELHHRLYTHPIRDWEGRGLHTFGDIIHSSLVSLHSGYTRVMSERYLVLFSFHLLILALDNSNQDFIYEGILPLSAIEVRVTSQQDSSATHMFEISGPMVDSKIFICANAADRKCWIESIEDRRYKSLRQQLSPSHSALSYLLPCDESWKKEELKRYLLRSPIWQWEGTPIQHMGQPVYLSLVHISNMQKNASQERLLMLFPLDVLILSVDGQRVHVKYEGRLPRKGIRALEKSALPGRLEFELTGDLMEPLLVSCTYPEDYQNWIFQLQQPEKVPHTISNHTPPPLIPKKRRS
ncbi:probable pleckstrin homology domain-containing family N member 1 [Salminus brasiliensis]|uniref:probable pleckstrin homology domain-containing family N member 1 n=1 Tax=Salminus brasiliensis TaxID=930266 RepID=UPI003B836F30